nr:hypothetical protein [Pandoravirus aubagnensis]
MALTWSARWCALHGAHATARPLGASHTPQHMPSLVVSFFSLFFSPSFVASCGLIRLLQLSRFRPLLFFFVRPRERALVAHQVSFFSFFLLSRAPGSLFAERRKKTCMRAYASDST